MREIKFRGKRPLSGKWIYGFPYKKDGFAWILSDRFQAPECSCEVLAETVGQFIIQGIFEYYEFDIVCYTDAYKLTNGKDADFIGIIKFSAFEFKAFGIGEWSGVTKELNFNFKTIGNFHDNPDLLK